MRCGEGEDARAFERGRNIFFRNEGSRHGLVAINLVVGRFRLLSIMRPACNRVYFMADPTPRNLNDSKASPSMRRLPVTPRPTPLDSSQIDDIELPDDAEFLIEPRTIGAKPISAPSAPSALPEERRPVGLVDPFETAAETALLSVPESRAPSPRAAEVASPIAEQKESFLDSEQQEEVAADPVPAPAPAPAPAPVKMGRVELMALAGFALVALVAAGLFFKYLYDHSQASPTQEQVARFTLPLNGKVATITAATVGWRERTPQDRVRAEETVIPELKLSLDPSSAGTGFIKIEFLDSDQAVRGDVMTLALDNGKLKNSSRGEKISSDGTEATIVGTAGFQSTALFAAYIGGEGDRWQVRLQEGADYSKGPWTTLATVQIENTKN